MRPGRGAATLILPAFLVVQAAATLSKASIHPFSSYRMFSKNWPDGIVMERVVYSAGGEPYRPWDVLRIPFFQANQVSYATFLDPSSEAQREALCARQLAALPASTGELAVLGEEIRFARDGGAMKAAVVKSERVHVCRRS